MDQRMMRLSLLALCCLAAAPQRGLASWYSVESCSVNPDPCCPTASGHSLYDLEAAGSYFAASWQAPLGSQLRVCALEAPTRCVVVEILDRGPAKRLGRAIDLCKACFSLLADPDEGIIPVTIERVP